ncbi:helix-turn-helix transcriptional regulator [Streptomyces xiamenensis]|uniref:helix-turn-helix transcriptional regulator n=1 Tax=Streptomyces xiamenensis TaxID=408015 RepID=UPI0035D93233
MDTDGGNHQPGRRTLMPQPLLPLDPTRSPRHHFGAHLRHWRGVRGMSQAALAAKVHVSRVTVTKIETADRPCSIPLARSLDQILDTGGILEHLWKQIETDDRDGYSTDTDRSASNGAPSATDMLDGQTSGQRAPTEPGMGTQYRFIALSPTANRPEAIAPGATLPSHQSHLPEPVRETDIEQIDTAATVLTSWDHRYGGLGLVQQASATHLRWATNVLAQPCPLDLQPQLFTAAARLGMVAGAIGFDAGDVVSARRDFALACAAAEEAGAWQLRAKICSFRARVSVWSGEAKDAVVHADLGLAHRGSLTGREQAMLHTARARALALSGDHAGVLDAVAAADKAFESSRGQGPPWMAYLDFAQHQGDTGHALGELALHTRDRFTAALAANRLREAVTSHADDFPRSRAFSRTLLAELTMMAEDPDEGSRIGAVAVAEVQSVRSRRAIVGLRRLAREAARHRPTAPVIHLRERISECLA